ncbi:MAG: tRNA lysidine(34) synthetase TilS [Paracholeplasma sp.]|nr:tRNA lysidine(34) synthetase TilS [Paracholeplasma sp.]MDY3196554.1 tRNA lysidine(34) synthetase TilS [Paracholeplasma sp.]
MNSIKLLGLNELKNTPLIASISGGVDSMVLLDLLIKENYQIIVVHFNHNKRLESLAEANALKDYTSKRNIPFEYIQLEPINDNFQAEAHKLRKKHLIEIAKKYQSKHIITAHHLNDLAETILMKLSRGSNLYGYAGMQIAHQEKEMTYLKPLLHEKKQTLYDYATAHDLMYFEDASNQADTYTRNRFRNHIVVALEKENNQFLEKTLQFSNLINETSNYILKQVKPYLTKDKLNVTEFNTLDVVLKKAILSKKMEENNIEVTNQKLEDAIHFLSTSGPNQSLDLSKDYVLQRVYNQAQIRQKSSPKPFKMQLDLNALNILPNMGYITFLKDQFNSSNYEIKLCYNKLALPLYVRSRENGDTLIFPYGKKKLKDFYIDHKIPKYLRDTDLIITDCNNQILAVLGRYYNKVETNNEQLTLVYKRGI